MWSSLGLGTEVRGGEGTGEWGHKREEGSRQDEVIILVGRWNLGMRPHFL